MSLLLETILQFKISVLQIILGALPMAVDAVNNDSTLLPGRTLRYIAHDIGKDATSSIAIKYKVDK